MREDWEGAVRAACKTESEAIEENGGYMDYGALEKAVTMLEKGCKIAVSGCGHSGIAARHLAHLLCCVERPARFLSPEDAASGELGFLGEGDVLVLASRGGETKELFPLLQGGRDRKARILAVTENRESFLAREADVVIPMRVNREIDPDNCQGTTSFLVMSAIFQIIQLLLIERLDYKKERFARIHPQGAVGKRLREEEIKNL